MRILNTTEKSELGVKRNVFEKAPAYERGSKNTEHKISDFTEKKWTCQLRLYRPKGDLDSS